MFPMLREFIFVVERDKISISKLYQKVIMLQKKKKNRTNGKWNRLAFTNKVTGEGSTEKIIPYERT